MNTLKPHHYATLFPPLKKYELEDLAKDIKTNGLRQPIILFHDEILDGFNRYKACELAGIQPRFETFDGNKTEAEALAYIVSANLKRRHLTQSERALLGAKISEAKRGGNRGNQFTNGKVSQDTLPSIKDAARLMEVSPQLVSRAKIVLDSKDKALIEQVESRQKTVTVAAREVKFNQKKTNWDSVRVSEVSKDGKEGEVELLTYREVRLKLTSKELKLLNKAVNPESPENEWQVAMVMFGKSIRTRYTNIKAH